jgi:hypothetical protein
VSTVIFVESPLGNFPQLANRYVSEWHDCQILTFTLGAVVALSG